MVDSASSVGKVGTPDTSLCMKLYLHNSIPAREKVGTVITELYQNMPKRRVTKLVKDLEPKS